MAPVVVVYTTPPEALIERLARSHLPHALPMIRRLRFARFPGGITEHTRILWSSASSLEEDRQQQHQQLAAGSGQCLRGTGNGEGRVKTPFAAAYLDFSRGPETELWIYSSMEHRLGRADNARLGTGKEEQGKEHGGEQSREEGEGELEADEEGEKEEIACAVALLREAKRQQDLYFTPGSERERQRESRTVLVGNLSEVLRRRLVAPDVGMVIDSTGIYDMFMFRVDELPDVALPEFLVANVDVDGKGEGKGEEEKEEKEEGKRWIWDSVRKEDIPFAISRTNILRKERTMKLLPSTALYLDDGSPIAWAFLSPDSSLSSLHCEEPYRGKGIAKAVAVRILRDHLQHFGSEGYGYGWADVAPDNIQSRGVCRSLGGKVMWQITWSRLDLDQYFPG